MDFEEFLKSAGQEPKIYCGFVKLNDEYFAGAHKPIISKKIFNAVQDKLNSKIRRKIQIHDFLFSRKIQCHCGRKLIGEKQAKLAGKIFIYYRCHNPKCDFKKSINEKIIEKSVENFLEKNKLTTAGVKYFHNILAGQREDLFKTRRANRALLTRKLNEIDDEMKGYFKMRSKKEMSAEEFKCLKKWTFARKRKFKIRTRRK